MTASVKKVLFWIHLSLGVVGGIVILAMCVTGALLAFEKNIIELAEYDQRTVTIVGPRLSPSAILTSVSAADPDAKITSIQIESAPNSAATVSIGRGAQIFVDPYSGRITGSGNRAFRSFFRIAEDVHRFLALSGTGRPTGRAITGFCNLLFLGLAISGPFIWMPRKITLSRLRPVIWFRRTHSVRARNFNWHAVIGFWCSLILIVLTLTATVLSYNWASDLLYKFTGNEPPAQRPPAQDTKQTETALMPSNLDELWVRAESQWPGWTSITLRLPVSGDAAFTISDDRTLHGFGRSSLTLSAATGDVIKWEPFETRNSGQKLRTWFRFLHTGEALGFGGQFVAFIACLGGSVLVYTGLSLSVRRMAGWLRRRRRVAH